MPETGCSAFKCRSEATIYVPTGYGAIDKMCEHHASEWAEVHRLQFARMVAFYDVIDSPLGFHESAGER